MYKLFTKKCMKGVLSLRIYTHVYYSSIFVNFPSARLYAGIKMDTGSTAASESGREGSTSGLCKQHE